MGKMTDLVYGIDMFVEIFGNIVEHSALVAAALWTRSQFSTHSSVR